MAVTAARLGSSPLRFDWTHLGPLGEPDVAELEGAWARLRADLEAGKSGFFHAVGDGAAAAALNQAAESRALAERLLAEERFTDCLFIGIGGSALGPKSLLRALEHETRRGIRFHFMENPDPVHWHLSTHALKPESTLVCAVAKSGGTFETISQFLIALQWLGKERWKSNVVCITDPAKGDLRAFAEQNGLMTLAIAPSVGGRYSVFTPVGLFPAALAGLSVPDFLLGATQAREAVEKTSAAKNPLFLLADYFIGQAAKRSVHVMMPYSTRLKACSEWWVQLWGESLGKDRKGFTPVAAVGATDQHSILQLLRDGPDDKITFFVTVAEPGAVGAQPIPRIGPATARLSAFTVLEGHTLHDLITTEYRATSLVLTQSNRPNLTLQLERLDARNLGAFYFSMCALTAFTGALWGVNPFDQPGVEDGKVHTRDALAQARAQRLAEHDAATDPNSPVQRLRRGWTE